MARRRISLVYGGAHRGLMGVLADAMLEVGGRVVGVIPRALVDLEVAHRGLTELHVVDTMHQRKAMMFTLADAFVVGPGGLGTLEEAFETLTGIQLGYHAKPIVFLEVDDFWAPMAAFLESCRARGRAAARSPRPVSHRVVGGRGARHPRLVVDFRHADSRPRGAPGGGRGRAVRGLDRAPQRGGTATRASPGT